MRELRNVLERLIVGAGGSVIQPNELPLNLRAAVSPIVAPTRPERTMVSDLLGRMLLHGESFWTAVADPFVAGNVSRGDLRDVVRIGVERSKGKERNLLVLFNIQPHERTRFLRFLDEHDCSTNTASPRQRSRRSLSKLRHK